MYAYFYNSENCENTILSYSNSVEYAKKNANRSVDNWKFNILKENAKEYRVPFKEICKDVWQVSLVPTDLELASWLSDQFHFNDFKVIKLVNKVDNKFIAHFKEGEQIEVFEDELYFIFRTGGLLL